jgi:hypothetical protein
VYILVVIVDEQINSLVENTFDGKSLVTQVISEVYDPETGTKDDASITSDKSLRRKTSLLVQLQLRIRAYWTIREEW